MGSGGEEGERANHWKSKTAAKDITLLWSILELQTAEFEVGDWDSKSDRSLASFHIDETRRRRSSVVVWCLALCYNATPGG